MSGSANGPMKNPGIGRARFDARLVLVVYVRVLSVVFLFSGLARWATILGISLDGGDFLSQPSPVIVATLFFSVADLVAAVGLWLLASWGTVVWMISALTETALYGAFAAQFGRNYTVMAFHIGSVVLYAALTYLYERARDRQ
ncbi:DUF6163 family protein [Oryzibacter oryziterrae]|uniref:DUF6163 family protein n=1 Tax=Oryzibacter oryziterrae TaxID=2766474 RepID=UPI001F318276|nr:DUF6163 family protein [Oryzibacter oryziterrae]